MANTLSLEDTEYLVSNPTEYDYHGRPGRPGSLWLFSFGAYADRRVLVWEDSLEDALEEAAGCLQEAAPGTFVDQESLDDLYKEALAASVEAGDDPEDEEVQSRAYETATTDLTYTESGYLPSWEWTVDEVQSNAPLFTACFDLGRALEDADEEEEISDACDAA